jgi:hypothetical protein
MMSSSRFVNIFISDNICTEKFSREINGKTMLILCYHTDDQKLINIADRYWATDKNGKYLENSTSFFSLTGVTNGTKQNKILANIASVFKIDARCPTCHYPHQIQSRSASVSAYLRECDDCMKTTRQQQENLAAEKSAYEEKLLRETLQQVNERNRNKTADYKAITDDLALLVLALDRAFGNQLFNTSFKRSQCVNFVPANAGNYITRLLHAGLLIDNSERASPDAYFLKENQLCYYSNRVVYEAVPDKVFGACQDVMSILIDRPFNQGEVLRSLWVEYATIDCIAYISFHCSKYGLETNEEEDKEIENTLRVALNTYSVACLWCAIWKVIKDAAALSTRKYYNRRKAAATISGKLKRHLEDVTQGKRQLSPWTRPAHQVAGTLGELFYEMWKIDENTPGTEVVAIFATHPKTNEKPEFSLSRLVVTELLRRTIEHDLAPEMLMTFANSIAEGESFEAALETAISALPDR